VSQVCNGVQVEEKPLHRVRLLLHCIPKPLYLLLLALDSVGEHLDAEQTIVVLVVALAQQGASTAAAVDSGEIACGLVSIDIMLAQYLRAPGVAVFAGDLPKVTCPFVNLDVFYCGHRLAAEVLEGAPHFVGGNRPSNNMCWHQVLLGIESLITQGAGVVVLKPRVYAFRAELVQVAALHRITAHGRENGAAHVIVDITKVNEARVFPTARHVDGKRSVRSVNVSGVSCCQQPVAPVDSNESRNK